MPRSARKSKPEKSKQKPSVKETTPTKLDLETEDSHLRGFTQAEWSNMLIQEDGDEAVGEIMDDLLCQVMDKCYKVNMEKQLAAFSVSWAKSYIIQTLESQILYTEEAKPVKTNITEDSEPVPTIPDSWAQGCVPVVHATYQPPCSTQEESDSVCTSIQTKASFNKQHNIVSRKASPIKQDEEEISPTKDISDIFCNVLSTSPPPKNCRNKKQHANKASKNGPRKLLPSLGSSTRNNNVEVECKKMEHSADKQKTALLHQHKNQRPIPKLDPLSLPQHWISPQYEILDNDLKPSPKRLNGPPRPEPKSNKQQRTAQLLTYSKDEPERFQRRNEDDVCLPEHGKEREMLSGPVKLDSMVLAEGVSLLEPQHVKMKPIKLNYLSQSAELKLIKMYPPVPVYSVDQITAGPPPRVVPLSQSTNFNS